MAFKSSSEKTQMKQKIVKKEEDTAFFDSKHFAFFGGIAFISTVIAGFTFFSIDFENRKQARPSVIDKTQEIDYRTTATIGRPSPVAQTNEINVTQRKAKDVETRKEQNHQIDNLRSMVKRLRNEQAILNVRIAELEGALSKNSGKIEKLQKDLNLAAATVDKAQESIKLPINDSKTYRNPERQEDLSPKSVAIRKIPLSTRQKNLKTIATQKAHPNNTIKSKNQIEIAKTAPLTQVEIDKTIVSSVSRVNEAEFAIDLGINPTKERAENLWKILLKNHSKDLSGFKPVYIKTGSTRQETRLIAGPFADASDAIRLCVQLKLAKNNCKTTLMPK